MKKRVNLKNRVSALVMSFFLASGLIAPTFSIKANAEALPEVINGACSLADVVMATYTSAGITVANQDWINRLYSSFGSDFGTVQDFVNQSALVLNEVTGQYVDNGLSTMISNVPAYTSLGLDTVFNVSAAEAENIGASGAIAGSVSLASSLAGLANFGVVGLGIGTVGYCGFEIGNILAHMLGLYGDNILAEIEITNIDVDTMKANKLNGDCYTYTTGLTTKIYGMGTASENLVLAPYTKLSSSGKTLVSCLAFNYGSKGATFRNIDGSDVTNRTVSANTSYTPFGNFGKDEVNGTHQIKTLPRCFNSKTEAENYLEGVKNGTIEHVINDYSPDLIGADGNIRGRVVDGEKEFDGVTPRVNPETQSVDPSKMSLEDWLRFANSVKDNLWQPTPDPDANKNLNDEVVSKIILPTPTPLPNPTPDPEPDPEPDPGPETYPVPGPEADPIPVPDPEYQPETKPQPQYTEKSTENETDITEGDPWTTPDLLDKFPFCIPRDVYRVFTKLDSGARSAPHIQWRFNPNNKIDYTFDIDFSEWDSIAALLRTLELLGFIVALAVATRKMILS